MRQLGPEPVLSGQQNIDLARQQLTVLVQELRNAMKTSGVVELHSTSEPIPEPIGVWDEIVYEPVPGGPNLSPGLTNAPELSPGPIQIEHQLMPLPSNNNVASDYAQLEVDRRIIRTEYHLNRIRDLIAEKSFQYSHVIRVAPRKAVNTRSRAEVKKINLQISLHCRLYTHCRARLVLLRVPPETMNHFKILTVEDIKASTAIVNPNEPGSTHLRLSWIWQSSGGHRWNLSSNMNSGPGTGTGSEINVMECEFFSKLKINNHFSDPLS